MEALKMETPMDSWNDDRLDELSRRVDDGFKEAREGFARIDERFEKVDQRFGQVATKEEMGEIKADLRHLNDKFDRLLHALTVAGLSFGITLFATVAGLVLTQV
jgi:archaellum component FlaC